MALTPYPSLATLPEVVANGGKIPARSIDAFAARTVYASTVPGVVLDCDIHAGTKVGGGTPTNNAAALNAVLATATVASPVKLIIDGGCALGAPLIIPQTGHVTIEGQGWGTGFYWLPGSNCSQIQTSNVGTTDLSHYRAVHPSNPQSIAGKNVRLANFHMNCNRGTFPTGLVNNYAGDGTLPGSTGLASGPGTDARGPTSWYFLTSILIVGIENLHIDRVSVYDSPSYAIDLYHCSHVWVDHCRVEAGNPSFSGNTDGLHVNGGCSHVFVTDCWFSTGDDAIAFNLNEGDGQPGGDFLVDNCTFVNCQTIGRIHGQTVNTRRVTFSNCQGYGTRAWAFAVGNGTPTTSECNHSIYVRNCDIQVSGPSLGYGASFLYLDGACGLVELENCHLVDPTSPVPMVLYGQAQPTVSALRMLDCGIHRSGSGSAACPAFATESGGQLGDLTVRDFHLTEQRNADGTFGGYADVPAMIDLGKVSAGRLSVSGSFRGAATVVNVPSTATLGSMTIPDLHHVSNASPPTARSIVNASGAAIPVSVGRLTGANIAGIASGSLALIGPGIMPSGYAVADSLMGNGSPYLGSDHGNVPCVKVGGTAKTINLT